MAGGTFATAALARSGNTGVSVRVEIPFPSAPFGFRSIPGPADACDRYLVVNAAPECPYDQGAYATGSVMNLDIQDHTPPTMQQMVAFCERVGEFMRQDDERVVVIHCKGCDVLGAETPGEGTGVDGMPWHYSTRSPTPRHCSKIIRDRLS